MIRKIIRAINFNKLIKDKEVKDNDIKANTQQIPKYTKEVKEHLKDIFSVSDDFIIRRVVAGKGQRNEVLIAFIDGLVNKELIDTDVMKPIMDDINQSYENEELYNFFKDKLINTCVISEVEDFNACILSILSGDTIIFIDGSNKALKVGLRSWDKRSVEEPPSDVVIRGPREGFTETLRTNTTLLRRKIKNTNLKFDTLKVGEQTNTDVCICYIQGIANDELIANVKNKISKIQTDAVLESGYLEEFIEDYPFSIFPTVGNSEKPDIVAAKILEGRIAILCDGTPFVLTVPYLFVEALQSSEDYYSRYIYSALNRFVRALALFITSMLPALYVALVSFHQDIIPYKLLLTMTASREGIPFSSLTEALAMVVTFELLREAGIRMPRAIGQAVSIVGALVIGDAAVKAGLVSTPMVIVIAITAITSFIVPSLSGSLLIIRIITMLAAGVIGILGIALVSIAFFIHACKLIPFGVNYLSPVTPLSGMDLKDTFIRFPLWMMFTRPKLLTWEKNKDAKYRIK